jgi:xanthine dehydrogenase YagS FAD-binding subunit
MYKITHVDATSVDDAVAKLADGSAAPIAGGTDLITTLKGMCIPTPPAKLVNLKTISGLKYIKEEGGMLKIGALTTLTEIAKSSVVKSKYTVLAEAAKAVASPELRNAGTIGGNICQMPRCPYFRNENNAFNCLRKDSSGLCYALTDYNVKHSIFGAASGCVDGCPSDVAPALVALGAKIKTSKRTVDAADFFAVDGLDITALEDGEIVVEIQVPELASGTKSAYRKFAFRKSIDFPLVSAAVVIGGSDASIVLGGVYPIPRRAAAAEDAIKGKAIDETSAAAASEQATKGSVALGQNKYKIQIAKVMTKRAILACK